MKKTALIIFSLSIILIGFAIAPKNNTTISDSIQSNGDDEKGISFFEGTWEEALSKAKKEDKLIFLDAYASWCGPCKLMAKKTFPDEEVGEFYNKHFINVKMDMEKHPEGPRLSKKFSLTAYPTLYFLDKNEDLVHKQLGYLKPKQLITVGELALEK